MNLKFKKILRFLICSIIFISLIFLIVKITKIEAFKWLYFGILIIIDIFFLEFVNWTPWKKKVKKEQVVKNKIREWIESVLFAIIAATLIHVFLIQPYVIPTSSLEGTLIRGDFLFVSKFNYGSNVPNTPLFLPFMHNKLPFTDNTPSYLDWVQLGYNRLPGFQKIQRNDIVVFNWPTDNLQKNMPFDKKTNYVKRCVGISGDTLEIKNGDIFINGEKQSNPNRSTIQHAYWIKFENDNHLKYLKKIGKPVEKKIIEKTFQNNYNLEVSLIWPPLLTKKGYNVNFYSSIKDLIIHGTEDEVKKLVEGEKKQGYKGKISYVRLNQNIIDSLDQKFPFSVYGYNHNTYTDILSRKTTSLFPYDWKHNWDYDNYGPIYIPKKGDSIVLNDSTLSLYKNIIEDYEYSKVTNLNDSIYTFKMDYFWMMGDNRHNSQDSRAWGFVPENHVVGKPIFLWLSVDLGAKNIFNKVRWKRMFTTIHGEGKSGWYLPYFIIFVIILYFRKKLFLLYKKHIIKN